jgi:FMN-dependent NADH-azoreductase
VSPGTDGSNPFPSAGESVRRRRLAYLRAVFAFIGIEDVEFMRAEGLAFGPEQRDAAIRAALAAVPAAVTQLAA